MKADDPIERLLAEVIRSKRKRFYARAVELGLISREQAFNLRVLHIIEDNRTAADLEEAAEKAAEEAMPEGDPMWPGWPGPPPR